MLKNKIAYLAVIISVALINTLYIDYEPFVLLIALLVFPVVLFIVLCIQRCGAGIALSQNITPYRDTYTFRVRILNTAFLPMSRVRCTVYATYSHCEREKLAMVNVSVMGNGIAEQEVILPVKYCGPVLLQIQDIYIYDWLGLFKKKKKCEASETAMVLPRVYLSNINSVERNNESGNEEFSQNIAGDDYSEIFELRDYREGDNLSRVHWKLSSKNDIFIVKEYSHPLENKELVLLELVMMDEKSARESLDALYTVLYSIFSNLNGRERVLSVAYYDTNNGIIRTEDPHSIENINIEMKNIIMTQVYRNEGHALQRLVNGEFSHYKKVYYLSPKKKEIKEFFGLYTQYEMFVINKDNIQEIVDFVCNNIV